MIIVSARAHSYNTSRQDLITETQCNIQRPLCTCIVRPIGYYAVYFLYERFLTHKASGLAIGMETQRIGALIMLSAIFT